MVVNRENHYLMVNREKTVVKPTTRTNQLREIFFLFNSRFYCFGLSAKDQGFAPSSGSSIFIKFLFEK